MFAHIMLFPVVTLALGTGETFEHAFNHVHVPCSGVIAQSAIVTVKTFTFFLFCFLV